MLQSIDGIFVDIETAVLDWLETAFTALVGGPQRRVDTVVPVNVQELLIDGGVCVRVGLVSSRDDGVTEFSVLDVEVFADSRDTAYAFAQEIRARFSGRSHRFGQVIFDTVTTEEGPHRLPWQDENTARFGATYRISARR